MKIRFAKLSDEEHRVEVIRRDGSVESATLNTRSFLRHDFAHFATESCVRLESGYWGMVAAGASLAGDEIRGPQAQLAEALAAPVQTLMRVDADLDRYQQTLAYVLPDRDCTELAQQVKDCAKKLEGHWRATPYGDSMEIDWPEND